MAEVEWRPYDCDRRTETAPGDQEAVWIMEDGEGVAIGYFDGVWYHWTGVSDTRVTHWAPITYPGAPSV